MSKAFSIYMSVYLQNPANLSHLPHLIIYTHEIESMAENGLNFLEYDKTFRKERAGMSSPGTGMCSARIFLTIYITEPSPSKMKLTGNYHLKVMHQSIQFPPGFPLVSVLIFIPRTSVVCV